jgi:Membrane protein involved in the export of O-antigen and teichoic acid
MPSIKKNIVANLIGKVWSAAISILLIPQYIKYLGIESYGLIGFYATLIGSMAVLDLGLSTTLNRELAKYRSENRSVKDIRDLTFSLERIYWVIGIIICFSIIGLSGFIASHWIRVETLPLSTVRGSVMVMGAVIAFQWPISLYSGGLTGLEKQVINNGITVVMTTIRAAGVIIILRYFSQTLQAFFLWQAATSFLYVMVMRWKLWDSMPVHSIKAAFSKIQIKIIWRFAAGMTGISFITFFIAQIDKIVLSKLLPLSQFGYYTLAFTVATGISLIVGPVSLTFFPRITHLVAANKNDELKILYHRACRLISSLIFPICFILLLFTKEIISIWTKNNNTSENTYLMAQILIIGSIFNSLMVMPHYLLVANGWTRFIIYQNTIAAIILLPLLFLWTSWYGAIGATFVWVIVNVGYVFISLPLMHRRLLKNELSRWYLKDTLLPMIPSLMVVLITKLSLHYFFPNLQINLVIIGTVFLLVMTASLINIPDVRIYLWKFQSKIINDRSENK